MLIELISFTAAVITVGLLGAHVAGQLTSLTSRHKRLF